MAKRQEPLYRIDSTAEPNLCIRLSTQSEGRAMSSMALKPTELGSVGDFISRLLAAFSDEVTYVSLSLLHGFELSVGRPGNDTDLLGSKFPRYVHDLDEVAAHLCRAIASSPVCSSATDAGRKEIKAHLHAISRLAKDGYAVYARVDGVERQLPVVPLVQFAEQEEKESWRGVDLLVRGIDRDDEHGHVLRLGNGKVMVHLPLEGDPQWYWPNLRDVLDHWTRFVGGIRCGAKSSIWVPDTTARLVRQPRSSMPTQPGHSV